MKKLMLLAVALCATAFADDSYKIIVTANTVATNGLVSWNCTKNGTIILSSSDNVGVTSQAHLLEILQTDLKRCKELGVGTLTEVKESDSPPPVHGAAMHDSTVEATASKGAANGYAGLDSGGKVSATQMPALTGDVTTVAGAVAATLPNIVTAGTNPKVTYNAKGQVTAGAALVSGDIPNNAANTSGTASNITGVLPATSMPALTGDVTNTQGATATSLKPTGTAGTYQQVTTDAQGRVTAGAVRTVNASSPLGGGGALSADLTLTCATCAVRVASGTATFAVTAIASLACSATVTVAATGALTTDKAEWAYATAPIAATDSRLTINVWLTAGNINFSRCNNTAASITPTAIVANWMVTR